MSHTTHAAIDCTQTTDTDTSTLSGGRWSAACHIQHTQLLIVHTRLIQTPQHSVVDAGHQHVTYNTRGYWLYTPLILTPQHSVVDAGHQHVTYNTRGYWLFTPLILTPQHSVVDAGHQHVTYNIRGYWLYTHHWYRHLNTQWWMLVISMSHTTYAAIDCTHTTDTDTSTLSGGRWSSACHIQHTRLLIVHTTDTNTSTLSSGRWSSACHIQHTRLLIVHTPLIPLIQHTSTLSGGHWSSACHIQHTRLLIVHTPLILTPQHSVVDAGHQHVTYNTRGHWLYTCHWYRHLNTQWWTLVISMSHTTHAAIDCTQTTDTDTSTLSGGRWSAACHIQHTRLLIVHTRLIQTPQHSVVDAGQQHVTYNTRGYWLYTHHWHLNTQWWTLVISMSHTTHVAIDCTHTTDTDTSTLSGGRWSSACHIQHTRLLIVHTPQTPQHSVVDAGHQHVTYNTRGYWLYTLHWYRHLNTQWWTLVISMSHTTYAAIDCTHSTDTDTSTLSGGRWSSACHIQHTRLLIVHTPLTPQHSVVDAGHQHVTYNIRSYWLYTHHWYRHLNTQWWTLVISMSHTTHAAIDCTHTTDTDTSTLSGGHWSSACHIQHTRLLIVHTTDTDTSTLSGGRWSSACHIQHTRLLIVHKPLISHCIPWVKCSALCTTLTANFVDGYIFFFLYIYNYIIFQSYFYIFIYVLYYWHKMFVVISNSKYVHEYTNQIHKTTIEIN